MHRPPLVTPFRVHLLGALASLALGLDAGAADGFYHQSNLVSDGAVPAAHTDSALVNAWGIAFNPTGPVWIANNGSNTSTLYDGNGAAITLPTNPQQPFVVQVPGGPTGVVFNGTTGFAAAQGSLTGPARFIYATEAGTIEGWAPNVDFARTVPLVDNSAHHAVYKGLALAAGGTGPLLYATNFWSATVEVYDPSLHRVTLAGAFTDPQLPAGYAPFGIQAIQGDLYVTFAMQDSARHDNVSGPGLGIVDVFDANGHFLRRLISHGRLNAPWGLALAPAGFGKVGGCLLVGNFGDGRIDAYDPVTGEFVGPLPRDDDQPVQIDGLWGLAFGNGFVDQPADTLYFTAGPAFETHGLYGRIDVAGDHPEK